MNKLKEDPFFPWLEEGWGAEIWKWSGVEWEWEGEVEWMNERMNDDGIIE